MGPVPAGDAGYVSLSAQVRDGLRRGCALVALETSIVAHGLPHPANINVARDMAEAVEAAGAVPAFTAVADGAVHVGLDDTLLARLAMGDAAKASARDLARLAATGSLGATTVAGTLRAARAAGLEVMATGGIGGVHRGAERTFDVSPDLDEIRVTPMVVVAAGAKSILDLPRTLEWLETRGVPVIGWRTDRFPAFYVADSGLAVPAVTTLDALAAVVRSHWGLGGGGIVVVQPPPLPLAADAVERWTEAALAEAETQAIAGAGVTPFLLAELARVSDGVTVAANRALAVANAELAGKLAAALNHS